jgi:hypothetical protein
MMRLFSKRQKPRDPQERQPTGSLRDRALEAAAEVEARDQRPADAAEVGERKAQAAFAAEASRKINLDLGVDLSPDDWHVIGRYGKRIYGTVGHNDGVEIGRYFLAYAVVEGVKVYYDGIWCALGDEYGEYNEYHSPPLTLQNFGKALKNQPRG